VARCEDVPHVVQLGIIGVSDDDPLCFVSYHLLMTSSDPMPSSVELMQPTLARQAFSNPEWLFEPKWDGFRAICFLQDGGVRFVSRNRKSLTERFSDLQRVATSIKATTDKQAAIRRARGETVSRVVGVFLVPPGQVLEMAGFACLPCSHAEIVLLCTPNALASLPLLHPISLRQDVISRVAREKDSEA
jgi:hypothetical protein